MEQQRGWLQAKVERNHENMLHIQWDDLVDEVNIYWNTSSEHIEEKGQFLIKVTGASSCMVKTLAVKRDLIFD